MAATGLFVNLTLAEVEAIKAKAVSLITEGKTIMSYGDTGTTVTRQFPMNPKEVLEECNYALPILDPHKYKKQQKRSLRSNYGSAAVSL